MIFHEIWPVSITFNICLLSVIAGSAPRREIYIERIPQLHLAEGAHRCVGRVEILHQGSWATICDDSWSTSETHVVCRQIGCGVATSATLNDYFGSRPDSIHLNAPGCTGDETHLWHCPSWSWDQHSCTRWPAVGVICSGFVRLGGSFGLCSGRVEVNSGRGWILVSDVNFTFPTSQVICAELGCGKALSVLGNLSRNASEQVWSEEFQCEGQEPEVWLCPRVPCPGSSCHHGGGVEVICAGSPQIRLMNGNNRCEGRVEILQQRSWGTICHFLWDLKDAHVVCRELSCGVAVEAKNSAFFGEGSGPIWRSGLQCTGDESQLMKCGHFADIVQYCGHRHDAGVICSGFVRLAGGFGQCSGRVEVNPGGKWTPVSGVNFIFPTAQVICAELGCGKPVSVLGNVSKKANIQLWGEEFQCEGHETNLWFCSRAPCPGGSCQYGVTVEVVCSEYTEVRLTKNRTSHCEGQVEMNSSEGWKALCASHWSMANAKVVCRQLGCGNAIAVPKGGAYFVEGGNEIWKDRFHCSGDESFLWRCPVTTLGVPACAHGNTASVVCSGNQTQLLPQGNDFLSDPGSTVSKDLASSFSDNGQLRLVDGGGRCAGRVEVQHDGSWGTVCDDSWDLRDAHVVCRQLGCGVALNATVSAHFGQGSGPIWLDELNCTGDESHLWNCPSQGWGQHDCRHKEDVGVICSEFLALRLISKDQECAGWLEVFYNGTWGSICRSPMEATTLSIICSQLGCGDSGTLNYFISPREGSRLQWVDGIKCRKTDTSLWQCPSNAWKHRSCLPRDEAYITCAEQRFKSCPTTAPCTEKQKLRLVGGNSECSGRVEVWHEGSWGTVCDDSWDLAEAEVVCQQLGCGPALEALGKAAFGPGNGSIWLDEVQCRGRESSLWACARAPWGQSDCKHEEDAGVKCLGEMTTVSPTSRNASSVSAPGVFSLPVIICIILGALLFLVLVILGTQLHRWRAELQALPTFEDPLDEALYEEINYIIKPQKEVLFDNPENLSDDSGSKLPYYTDNNEENGKSAPEPLAQHVDVAGNGYDDVEELPAPKVPSSPEMSEMHFPSEDRDGTRNSQSEIRSLLTVASIPPQALKEAANYRIEEKEFSLFLRQEDPGYDDVELNAM